MDEFLKLAQSLIAFASMGIALLTFLRAREESSKRSSVEVAGLAFKLDSLAEKITAMAEAQGNLFNGYTSNEKRITLIEHRVMLLESKFERGRSDED